MIKICFVCTGNTCRSIMAERIMKKKLKNMGVNAGTNGEIKVSSRGLQANGDDISPNAKKVLKKFGYSASINHSKKLRKTEKSILYIAMTDDIKNKICAEKVISASALIGKNILDPYGGDEQIYVETLKEIENLVEILIKKLCLRSEL